MKTSAQLLQDLDTTDRRMRALIDDLEQEQLVVPYDRGINPPLWEVGHAAFFYEFFLLRKVASAEPRMPGYDSIWDSFEIEHQKRWEEGLVPNRDETFSYYERVLDEVRQFVDSEPYLVQYGIGHQNMHLESMIWCRQTLGLPAPSSYRASSATTEPAESADPAESAESADPEKAQQKDVDVPGGAYPIGTDKDQFCFDCEKPTFRAPIEGFSISRTLVTNAQFQAFVDDNGYGRTDLWSFRGRVWLDQSKATQPVYWRDGQLRHFDQWLDRPAHAPVTHVNYWEAEAYCNWAGRRLPSEHEWEAAARGPDGRVYPWGDAMDSDLVDMDGSALALGEVGELEAGKSWCGALQMLGTVWEWTTSQFLPYDGFCCDMYPYMSTLQFGDHITTKGGSAATSSCLIRASYRQAYFPDRRDAFTGFRTCAT
jgi:iron(II)-dependent oxidoreductase